MLGPGVNPGQIIIQQIWGGGGGYGIVKWSSLLYISTSCAPKTLVEICNFNIFSGKKLKKSKKFAAKFCKKHVFFEFAPKRWLTVITYSVSFL